MICAKMTDKPLYGSVVFFERVLNGLAIGPFSGDNLYMECL